MVHVVCFTCEFLTVSERILTLHYMNVYAIADVPANAVACQTNESICQKSEKQQHMNSSSKHYFVAKRNPKTSKTYGVLSLTESRACSIFVLFSGTSKAAIASFKASFAFIILHVKWMKVRKYLGENHSRCCGSP